MQVVNGLLFGNDQFQLSISLLQDFSVLKAFDCGIEAMNKFIRNDFQMSVENHFCEAYCVYSDKELIGLFLKFNINILPHRTFATVVVHTRLASPPKGDCS